MSTYDYYASRTGATNTSPPTTNTTSVGGHHERVTRILVVGETRVGKTLLIRRLCDHIFGDTSIESTAEDYSSFNSRLAAENAADDDDLGPEWGPTVGVAIEALKRSTTLVSAAKSVAANPFASNDLSMPSLYTPTSSTNPAPASFDPYLLNHNGGGYAGYGAPTAPPTTTPSLQYRGATNHYGPPPSTATNWSTGAAGGHTFPSQPLASTSAATAVPMKASEQQQQQQRCTVLQTVEFHELGGTHGYRDVARLPLQQLRYDGVIFVYHRRSLTSTVYLTEWYHWVRSVLATSVSVSSANSKGNSGSRGRAMPRFMLVGTELDGDELTAAAAGVRKEVDATLHIGTVAVSDEALLDGNFEVKVRTLESPQSSARGGRVCKAAHSVRRSLAWPYHVLWCLWHPFFSLSEQYQEERGPQSKLVTMCTRLLDRFVWMLYKLDQALKYLIAVMLFGPYQEAVVLGHARTKQTLEEIRKDEQCVAQAHVCRLDSDIALQSSLDELVAFFDILLRDD